MVKVRVWVKFECEVPYIIDVENPENYHQIREMLEKIDPSNWECDPDFYEVLGNGWRNAIATTDDFMEEVVDEG